MDGFMIYIFIDHRYGVLTTKSFIAGLRKAAPPGFDVDRWLRRSRIRP
jgi:hypothetical protein